MANSFSKEERVAFEDICQGFEDALVLSKNISVYRTEDTMMERANDIIWRPMPYIAQSFDGTDMTSNFVDSTQLSVPATLGYSKSSPRITSYNVCYTKLLRQITRILRYRLDRRGSDDLTAFVRPAQADA